MTQDKQGNFPAEPTTEASPHSTVESPSEPQVEPTPPVEPDRDGKPEPGAAAPPSATRDGVRFIVLFLLIFGPLYGAFSYWDFAREWIVDPWTGVVADVSAYFIGLFYEPISQLENVIITRGFAIDIIDGCNGITPLTLLLAGVLAFPATWRARFVGLAIGVPAVLVINMIRILALWVIGVDFPEWFDRSHLYVAQAFVILATAGIWLWWLGRFAVPAPLPPSPGDAGGDTGERTVSPEPAENP